MANISRSRKSGFTLRSGVMRRETLWLAAPPARTSVAGGQSATLFSVLNAGALALRPFTVIRTRMQVGIISDQNAATENMLVGYGFAVVSDVASTIGITAVPTPITDQDSDLFFVYQMLFQGLNVTSAIGMHFNALQQYTIDSKAMRKVEDGSDIVVTGESTSASDGSTIFDGGRFLVKLH